MREGVWLLLIIVSFYLLTLVGVALFVEKAPHIAVERSIWILVTEVCLFATFERRTALIMSSVIYGALLATIASFLIFQGA